MVCILKLNKKPTFKVFYISAPKTFATKLVNKFFNTNLQSWKLNLRTLMSLFLMANGSTWAEHADSPSVERRIYSPSGVKVVQRITDGYPNAKSGKIQENIETVVNKYAVLSLFEYFEADTCTINKNSRHPLKMYSQIYKP